MRFTYDNSAENERNPNRPPKRVVAGNRSTDEMGHFWVQVLPRAPGEGERSEARGAGGGAWGGGGPARGVGG